MALPKTPKIVWNTSKTLTFPGPADYPTPKSDPVGPHGESRSGIRDKWLTRTDYPLNVVVRYVPTIADVGSVNAYSTSDGWQDFLLWAGQDNTFAYYPDKDAGTSYTCYLLNDGDPQRDEGGAKYKITLQMRSSTKVTSY